MQGEPSQGPVSISKYGEPFITLAVPIKDGRDQVMGALTAAINLKTARLTGARTIITGISDAVAEIIVDLGIDWGNVETQAGLQTGLVTALNGLNHIDGKVLEERDK